MIGLAFHHPGTSLVERKGCHTIEAGRYPPHACRIAFHIDDGHSACSTFGSRQRIGADDFEAIRAAQLLRSLNQCHRARASIRLDRNPKQQTGPLVHGINHIAGSIEINAVQAPLFHAELRIVDPLVQFEPPARNRKMRGVHESVTYRLPCASKVKSLAKPPPGKS